MHRSCLSVTYIVLGDDTVLQNVWNYFILYLIWVCYKRECTEETDSNRVIHMCSLGCDIYFCIFKHFEEIVKAYMLKV